MIATDGGLLHFEFGKEPKENLLCFKKNIAKFWEFYCGLGMLILDTDFKGNYQRKN